MSESKSKTVETDAMEELVDYTAPLDPRGEFRDLVVGVNGEFIRIQRGASVRIKRKFLEAIYNAELQQAEAAKVREEATRATEAMSAGM